MSAAPMQPVALEHASRLVNHGPTVLVTTEHQGRRNVMAAAWSMPVEFTPPRIAVVVDKNTYTRELLLASGHFGLCLPTPLLADFCYAVGTQSGRDLLGIDKFQQHGITPERGGLLGLPMVPGCSVWMELRRIPEPHSEAAYDTVFAEVLWAQADERIFKNGRWDFRSDNADLHTLHHLGAGTFAVPSRLVQAK